MDKAFSKKITKIYIVCTIMVVYIHANNLILFEANNIKLPWAIQFFENFITDNLCRIAVPMFMFLSAFLLYNNLTWNTMFRKIIRRVRTLFVPYILWNVLYLIVFYCISYFPFINQQIFSITPQILLDSILFYKFNNAYWFMLQLILYSMMCPIIFPIIKNKWLGIILICLVYEAQQFIVIPKINFMALFFYLIGAYCSIHFKKYFMEENRNSVWAMLLFISTQLIWILGYFNIIVVNQMILWLAMMFSFYSLMDSSHMNKIEEFKKIHFFVYSLHILIIEIIEKLLFLSFPYNIFFCLIDFILSPLITISVCVIIDLVLRKYCSPLYKLLTGVKS